MQEKYKQVPKILSVIFDRILDIKTESNLLKLDIYLSFSKLSKWTKTQEKILISLKERINQGDYNLSDINDIYIFIELLFDWLSDNIYYVISTKTISRFDKKVHKDIISYIEKNDNFIDTKLLIDNIKSLISMVEYESLICVAIFAPVFMSRLLYSV